MAFFGSNRSTIDVESVVSCYSRCMPSFVAFPSVCTLQAYRFVHQIALGIQSEYDQFTGTMVANVLYHG